MIKNFNQFVCLSQSVYFCRALWQKIKDVIQIGVSIGLIIR